MPQNGTGSLFSRLEGRLAGVLKGLQYTGMSLIVVMMFLTVIHSLGRYIFAKPVPGIIELSSFMLVTMMFLSITYTQIIKGHVIIGIIVDRFPARAQNIIDSLTYLIALTVGVLAIRQTIMEGFHMIEMGDQSMILQIPVSPFYFVVGFGWALFSLAMLMQLIRFISRMIKR